MRTRFESSHQQSPCPVLPLGAARTCWTTPLHTCNSKRHTCIVPGGNRHNRNSYASAKRLPRGPSGEGLKTVPASIHHRAGRLRAQARTCRQMAPHFQEDARLAQCQPPSQWPRSYLSTRPHLGRRPSGALKAFRFQAPSGARCRPPGGPQPGPMAPDLSVASRIHGHANRRPCDDLD